MIWHYVDKSPINFQKTNLHKGDKVKSISQIFLQNTEASIKQDFHNCFISLKSWHFVKIIWYVQN